jgi:hypothetical protein
MPPIPDLSRVRWKIHLVGESEELCALAKMFDPAAAAQIRVWLDGKSYYLHAQDFEGIESFGVVEERGEVLVSRLNGLGFLKFGRFRPVRSGGLIKGDSPYAILDRSHSILRASSSLQAYIDHTPKRPPVMNATSVVIIATLAPTERWAEVADRHAPDVDDALCLVTLAVASEDWRLLYVVYEIIEDFVGQPSQMEKVGWATVDEIRRFKGTADSRILLGTRARHGRRTRNPPSKPMTFEEAGVLIRKLLLAWLRSLAESA